MKVAVAATALITAIVLAPGAADAKKAQKAVSRPASAFTAKPTSDPTAVYVSGAYVGRDPDPNIRAYMMKSPHDWDGPD